MLRIVIPARYQSSRLPGKPLVDIGGKPMIAHVYERALATKADSIVIATDDQRIVDVCHDFKAEVFYSEQDHQSGTERIAEVVTQLGYADDDIIINLQGDEPFVDPSLLNQVASILEASDLAKMSSLYAPIEIHEDIFNPNIVKTILDKNNYAMCFSRAAIPWLHGVFDQNEIPDVDLSLFKKHIGIYAYYTGFIKEYIELPLSPLEKPESLEQLRVLWNGYKIILGKALAATGQEVNTEADLEKARLFYKTLL